MYVFVYVHISCLNSSDTRFIKLKRGFPAIFLFVNKVKSRVSGHSDRHISKYPSSVQRDISKLIEMLTTEVFREVSVVDDYTYR